MHAHSSAASSINYFTVEATVFQTAADPNGSHELNLSATSSFRHDICCDIAIGKNLQFSWSNTTPVRLSTEGLVFIKKREQIRALSPLFRYGENSGDSTHAEAHFCTSCHYQIFF
jgi:hypothetical protein